MSILTVQLEVAAPRTQDERLPRDDARHLAVGRQQPSGGSQGEAAGPFLCHASEDKSFARELATALRRTGVNVWLDEWELVPGDSLIEGVFVHGIQPAGALVALLSEASICKPWVRKELNVAISRSLSEEFRIIPVLLGGLTEADLPTPLMDTLCVVHRTMDETVEAVRSGLLGNSDRPPLGIGTPRTRRKCASKGLRL
ncbi:MAG: toll/interleukin-1 receptor domain-containing protein [Bifidobacteriaceae bacterium]|nr:toll/interleukin-1 receptor domain-containing protein [Bifidobacteriaceae bacterium]